MTFKMTFQLVRIKGSSIVELIRLQRVALKVFILSSSRQSYTEDMF